MLSELEVRVCVRHAQELIAAGVVATLERQSELRVQICDTSTNEFRKEHEAPGRCPAIAPIVIADYLTSLRSLQSGTDRGPIVVLTHEGSRSAVHQVLSAGARAFLLETCSASVLLECVRTVSTGGTYVDPAVIGQVNGTQQRQILTPRQLDILALLAEGHRNKVIGERLGIAAGTVKTHVKLILKKLNAASRTEAAAIAHRQRLLVNDSSAHPYSASISRDSPVLLPP